MSFKDLRDLSESLKILGYPKNLHLQALNSNYGSLKSFYIVADILQWLAERLEPGTILPGNVDTELNRVLLIRSATEFFVTKSIIKLNPRKLYASSSATAKELLKITNILLTKPNDNDDDDNNNEQNKNDDNDSNYKSLAQLDIGDRMDDLRRARELSSELTKRGATLYDLLTKEMFNRETRINQLSRPMESAFIERTLKNAITSAQLKLQSSKTQLESIKVDKNSLNNKLQRKKAELDRSKQRLDALQKIRPAYLEEFQQLELELSTLFQEYFLRVQCRDSLKAQILNSKIKNPTPIATPITKPITSDNSINFIPDDLIMDDDNDDNISLGDSDIDDNNNDDNNVDDNNRNENLRKTISDDLHGTINDQQSMIKDNESRHRTPSSTDKMKLHHTNNANNNSNNSNNNRIRPTTGRFKPRTGTTIGRHKVIGSMLGDPDDETLDSTLGSGESDSDIDLNGVEYGLNSDDDISLSKLTGNVHNKTISKHDNHSDEDF